MTAVHASIELDAEPQAVWDVIMDPHRFSEWVTIHRKLNDTDEGALRPGFRVEQTLCLHHAPFKVRWRLGEHEVPWHSVWEGRGPAGSHARIVNTLTALPGGGTRFEYSNEFENPGGLLGRVAGRVLVAGTAEREANRSLQRLKRLVEAPAATR